MTYQEAKLYLKDSIQSDGGLYDSENYLAWNDQFDEAVLDGRFTAKQLMAIAIYMMGDK